VRRQIFAPRPAGVPAALVMYRLQARRDVPDADDADDADLQI